MMDKTTLYIILILIVATIAVGCDSNEETGSATIAAVADVTFLGEPIDTSEYYQLEDFSYRFDIARFYVGGFVVTAGGEEIDRSDEPYLLGQESTPAEANLLSDVSVASGIDEITFNIGVGPDINGQSEQDFLSRPVEDPLSVQDPAMHWNWNTGYRFIRIDGVGIIPIDTIVADTIDNVVTVRDTLSDGMVVVSIDTIEQVILDTIQVGADTVKIEYHLGTDDLLTTVTADRGFDRLVAGDENRFLVRLDLANLLQVVDLRVSSDQITHTFDNLELAVRMQEQLANGAIGYRLN